MDLFAEIFATMRMNRMRTFLTGFAIAWGIFMLVALLACGNGLKHGFENSYRYMNKNTVSLYPDATSIPFNGQKKGRPIRFRPNDIEFLRKNIPNCTDFAPIYDLWQSKVENGDIQISVNTIGVEPVYVNIRSFQIVAGRFINQIDAHQRRKSVVIPVDVSEKLFPSYADALGRFVTMSGDIKFQIVGVYKTRSRNWQPELYIPLSTANIIYNPSGEVGDISFSLVGITTKEETLAYTERLRRLLAGHFNYDPEDMNAIWINNRMADFEQTQVIFTGISLLVWVIGIGTLIAGIVGVCNIMIVTVRERTREFGVRKALGATPVSILRMVVIESVTITTIFGYVGMFFGIGLSELLCLFFPADAPGQTNSPNMFIEPSVDISIILSATLVLIVAGVVAGYIPARKAVHVKPIEAMNAK